jgi:hypothetical protein
MTTTQRPGAQNDFGAVVGNPYGPNSSGGPYMNIDNSNKAQKSPFGHLDDSLLGNARKQFIIKVYIIVFSNILIDIVVQLAITAAVSAVSCNVSAFYSFQK